MSIERLARDCWAAFGPIVERLSHHKPEQILLGELETEWNGYYFGPFARFDRSLSQGIASGRTGDTRFLPISISHHNLHRLYEVLRLEIGAAALSSTRSPERITDLVTASNRLKDLIADVCAQSESAARSNA